VRLISVFTNTCTIFITGSSKIIKLERKSFFFKFDRLRKLTQCYFRILDTYFLLGYKINEIILLISQNYYYFLIID